MSFSKLLLECFCLSFCLLQFYFKIPDPKESKLKTNYSKSHCIAYNISGILVDILIKLLKCCYNIKFIHGLTGDSAANYTPSSFRVLSRAFPIPMKRCCFTYWSLTLPTNAQGASFQTQHSSNLTRSWCVNHSIAVANYCCDSLLSCIVAFSLELYATSSWWFSQWSWSASVNSVCYSCRDTADAEHRWSAPAGQWIDVWPSPRLSTSTDNEIQSRTWTHLSTELLWLHLVHTDHSTPTTSMPCSGFSFCQLCYELPTLFGIYMFSRVPWILMTHSS